MRLYYWRTDAPCANGIGAPNKKKIQMEANECVFPRPGKYFAAASFQTRLIILHSPAIYMTTIYL